MRILKPLFTGFVLGGYIFGTQTFALWVATAKFGGNYDGWVLLGTCIGIAIAALAFSFAAPRLATTFGKR